MKQKSVAAAADSSVKLLQPVPGPARRYPPPAANVKNVIALRVENRIPIPFTIGGLKTLANSRYFGVHSVQLGLPCRTLPTPTPRA
jgi:hypothetical protein